MEITEEQKQREQVREILQEELRATRTGLVDGRGDAVERIHKEVLKDE